MRLRSVGTIVRLMRSFNLHMKLRRIRVMVMRWVMSGEEIIIHIIEFKKPEYEIHGQLERILLPNVCQMSTKKKWNENHLCRRTMLTCCRFFLSRTFFADVEFHAIHAHRSRFKMTAHQRIHRIDEEKNEWFDGYWADRTACARVSSAACTSFRPSSKCHASLQKCIVFAYASMYLDKLSLVNRRPCLLNLKSPRILCLCIKPYRSSISCARL